MAKMVTRTVIGTKATCKVINLTTDAISTEDIMLARTFDEGKTDLVKRACEKLLAQSNSNLAVVAVLSYARDEKLFGVPEAIFMAHAVELDKETRKPLNGATTEPLNGVATDVAETEE